MIELLTVIAIIGILAAILIPTVGTVRKKAAQVTSASNLRQIHIGHANYQINGSRTRALKSAAWAPTTPNQAVTPAGFAKALAYYGEFNDAALYYIASAADVATLDAIPKVVLKKDRTVDDTFGDAEDQISYSMARLSPNSPSITPLAWTKGLQDDGSWGTGSPWGTAGGHIIFSGGNVEFFSEVGENDLHKADDAGGPTKKISEAVGKDSADNSRILEVSADDDDED